MYYGCISLNVHPEKKYNCILLLPAIFTDALHSLFMTSADEKSHLSLFEDTF